MSRANSPNSEINFTTGDKDLIGQNNVQLLKLKRDIQDHRLELIEIDEAAQAREDKINEQLNERIEKMQKEIQAHSERLLTLEGANIFLGRRGEDRVASGVNTRKYRRTKKGRRNRK